MISRVSENSRQGSVFMKFVPPVRPVPIPKKPNRFPSLEGYRLLPVFGGHFS